MSQILKIGSLLDHGKYRVEKVLGQGGFGITYLVTDLGLDKLRAVKEFFPKDYCERNEATSQVSLGTTNTAELVNRLKAKFIKEARNIANLDQHHGIIKIHTVFEENNTAYYVMDYIEGESLSAMVKHSGPVPVERAIKYITEVGEALDYVHKHRINHLDVKPANIMIRKKDDKPILIDFGLAKQYDSDGLQTSTTPTGISHGFAPFEQYRDGGVKEFSPQTDVYSLAATLYYIVSGQIPLHATDLIENELTFPLGFPEALKEPIREAMSSKRQHRPESVSTFIESLNKRDNHARYDFRNSQQDEETIIAQPIGKQPGESGKDNDPQTPIPEPKVNKKNNSSWLYIGIALAVVIVVIILATNTSNNRGQSDNKYKLVDTDTVVDKMEVIDLAYRSSLGLCSYSGEVDENGNPHGHGVAEWDNGDAKSYDGDWNHGIMEGQTKYTLRNGDTFVGTFKNGKYDRGCYTIKSSGEYFEGTFKNGQPDKGSWYDKSGKKL